MVTLVHPLPGIKPSSGGVFNVCRRSEDGNPCGYRHKGVDLHTDSGTPIKAAASGVVTQSGFSSPKGGLGVRLLHSNGWQTRYLHLREDSKLPVLGKFVSQGEIIGLVGDTGNAILPHLHFELITLAGHVDAMPYLTGEDVTFLPPDSPGSPNPSPIDNSGIPPIFANLTCEEIGNLLGEGDDRKRALEALFASLDESAKEATYARLVECGFAPDLTKIGGVVTGAAGTAGEVLATIAKALGMVFSVRGLYVVGGGIIAIGGARFIMREVQ